MADNDLEKRSFEDFLNEAGRLTVANPVRAVGRFQRQPAPEAPQEPRPKPDHALQHTNYVSVREEPDGQEINYTFGPENVRMDAGRDSFLILGFDTEYKAPSLEEAVTHAEVKEGKARYRVLSYQFHALNDTGEEWNGIIIPDDDQRITFSQFIVYAIGKGVSEGKVASIPKTIYLVAHYDRADLPAFDDRDILYAHLNNIRNSIVTHGLPIKLKINFVAEAADRPIEFNIFIRDTILLAPATAKSLAEIGNLVGCGKLQFFEDKAKHRWAMENLDIVMRDDWPAFREYALKDPEICVRYFQRVVDQVSALTASRQLPSTLSNLGVKLLIDDWMKRGVDYLDAIGRERVEEELWDQDNQRFATKRKDVYREGISLFIDLVTECYHGGRNEQFWFGPSPVDDWSDFDLSGAYPTAMAVIGMPDWEGVRYTGDLEDFKINTLGFAKVRFRFPDSVRYPALPVRTKNGIVFPLEGESYCAAPEIVLALEMRCELAILHGVVVPSDPVKKPFFDFLRRTIAYREASTTEFEGQFWKEITNSCYGKTAQGLRRKRVFNIQKKGSKPLGESKITNPYYAAFITSMVRAVIGEIMWRLPDDKIIFSVTTDGFITNATDNEMTAAQDGKLCSLFRKTREALTGKAEILAEKHAVRQVLGWKTRGQATLVPGEGADKKKNFVLAKAGIKPPYGYESVEEQNTFINETFVRRHGEHLMRVDIMTSLRDMIVSHADFVRKKLVRKLNMEYDYKRQPVSVSEEPLTVNGKEYRHLVFSTRPWRTVQQFQRFRSRFDAYIKDPKDRCFKSVGDFRRFAERVETEFAVSKGAARYLSKKGEYPDVQRLRRDLCRAFKQGCAGLEGYAHLEANEFATIANQCGFQALGLPLTRALVENGRVSKSRGPFASHCVPPTPQVLRILSALEVSFPSLDRGLLLAEVHHADTIKLLSAVERAV